MLAVRAALAVGRQSLPSAVAQCRGRPNAFGRGFARNDGVTFHRLGLPNSSRGMSGGDFRKGRAIRQPPRHAGQGQHQTVLPAIIVVIIGGGVAVYALSQDEAPFTGRKRFVLLDRDGSLMTQMGDQTLNSVKRQYGAQILPRIHPATRTVERVGRRIAKVSGLEGYNWEFLVVRDKTINAFALPGGKVVVFTGLFEVTPNEDALASVLGHEIGHVVANHGGEKFSKHLLKEIVMFTVYSVTGIDLFGFGAAIGALFFDLPNSREMEREADYIGLQLMAKACFDPHEMPKTFVRMKAANKNKAKGPAYTSTHPSDDERIVKQREWMFHAEKEYENSGCSTVQDAFRNMFRQDTEDAFQAGRPDDTPF